MRIFYNRWRCLEPIQDLFYFSSSLSDSTQKTFASTPLRLTSIEWNLMCKSTRLTRETISVRSLPSVGFISWILMGVLLGNSRHLRIEGIKIIFGTVERAPSKPLGDGLAIEAVVLALLKVWPKAMLLAFPIF